MCCFVQYACVSFTVKALAVAALGLHWSHSMFYVTWGYILAVLWLHYGYIVAAATALVSARMETVLWLPCHPGENEHVCSSCCSLSLLAASRPVPAYPGFSKQCTQCEQQDSWCHKCDQQCSGIVSRMRSNTMIDIKPQVKEAKRSPSTINNT